MGRRALRKIDPNLDLSVHFLELESLPPIFDARDEFGRIAPLQLEIGSGKGLFLTEAAGSNPTHDYLGIEVAGKYARFAAARLAKAALPNARILHGDAQRFVLESLKPATIEAVHIYFPDPWWKKRHHKRRIMNETFLCGVQRLLSRGGRLHFWTDVKDYFDQSLGLIEDRLALAGPLDVDESTPEHHLDYRTHFERRMRLHEKAVYRAAWVKE